MSVKTIEYLKDTFKIGSEAFESSKKEARDVWDLYHNRQYTQDQKNILESRGQPAETFNVIKLFTRLLLGYYSTVINGVQAEPKGIEDVATVAVLNDVLDYTFRDNNFFSEGEKIKLDGILAGLMCVHVDVYPTDEKDAYGRVVNKVKLEHVPESELVLDPMSRLDDYSDARYIHRFRWLAEAQVKTLFGAQKAKQLVEYYNFTDSQEAEFDAQGRDREIGSYKQYNNYLVIHSVTVDSKGKTWETFWSNETILKQSETTHKEVTWPYVTTKIHSSTKPEYYGIYREIIETQKSINQALIKIQLMVNTQKAFVEEEAVEDLADFTTAFNRVTAVIPVRDLSGIRVENLSREVLDQYTVLDKALDRVQRLLGINDSFMGMAFASDSGRKVKLQQNAASMSLRYLTGKFETMYRALGWTIANLVKQYYIAHQILRITDEASGQRWVELNKPMEMPTGAIDPNTGRPETELVFEETLDPASGEPMIDDEGNYILAPIPETDTELAVSMFDMTVKTNSYNDEDEKSQLMLEQILAGNVGQMLSQVNPAGFFKVAGLSLKTMKTRYSPEIAAIFEQTSLMLGANAEAEQQAQQQAEAMPGQLAQQAGPQNGASSRTLNLPQNTNEQ